MKLEWRPGLPCGGTVWYIEAISEFVRYTVARADVEGVTKYALMTGAVVRDGARLDLSKFKIHGVFDDRMVARKRAQEIEDGNGNPNKAA